MFKNRKVVLSSVAIIFTLIVCAIFVNFTLANSGTPVEKSEADTSGSSTLVGSSNIDQAVLNSNDSSLKKTGEDKYHIVQILPDGLGSYATADTSMTEIVTASGYSGKISDEAGYKGTSDLWKYVYDGEYFRYAVFNGYKNIKDDMAPGAVQLTTKTVSDLNGMGTEAQEILANADFIYIVATTANDYAAGGTDISESLYNWLDVYAGKHPIIFDRYALCTAEPETITGNNDQYRMGSLAYKYVTKTLKGRTDNVLCVEPGFFNVLYKEASGNKSDPMTNTTKTISDFILTAERSATEGGKDYINKNRYYKWYTDDKMENFLNNKTDKVDSAYAKISGNTQGISGSRHEWKFDNANVLVITDGTSNSMFADLASKNDAPQCSAENYVYNSKKQTWESVVKAPNSAFTSDAYAGKGYKFVPSGANIYQIQSADLLNGVDASKGAMFSDKDLAKTYFEDVAAKQITGTIKSKGDLTGSVVYLVVTPAGEASKLAGDTNGTVLAVELTTGEDGNGTYDEETGIYTYEYGFPKVNAEYTYSVLLEATVDPSSYEDNEDDSDTSGDNAGTGDNAGAGDNSGTGDGSDPATDPNAINEDYLVGSNGNDFIVSVKGESKDDAYDYTNDCDEYKEYTDKCAADPTNYTTDVYTDGLILETAEQVYAYVDAQYKKYKNEVLLPKITGTNVIDFTEYDFIFIESGDYKDEIGDSAYQKLCSAVEEGVYVIASSEAGDGIGSGNNNGGGSDDPGKIIINSPSAKVIADIINAGIYRRGSDNKFKVLEIQPDYPIDEELARSSSVKNGSGAWTNGTNTHGEKIYGHYYTVPSDVAEGYAVEELSPGSEYYDFDLTKAKIAYAIDGISYSDIELTQVSSEALIGMTDDIAAAYDLVYIGGDISALDRDLSKIYDSSVFAYIGPSAEQLASAIPTFVMYYHTGVLKEMGGTGSYKMTRSITGSELMATPVIGSTKYKTTYVVENGNDLTKNKYDELVSYVNLGRPIMVGNELTSVFEKVNGTDADGNGLTDVQKSQGYWYNEGKLERKNFYLDPSSRMYDLLKVINSRREKSTNVLWGLDATDTRKIDNSNKQYGDTLYTYKIVEDQTILDSEAQQKDWYKDATDDVAIKTFATVFSEDTNAAINNLVKQSTSRARLTVTSAPVDYSEGISSTYLKTTNLSFTFSVMGSDKDYKYSICIDKNKNTQFDHDNTIDYYVTGSIESSTGTAEASKKSKTVNIALDQDFFGSAYWQILIMDSKDNIIAEERGICKIVNNTDGISDINVLQVQTMSEGQGATSWGATDTLYFDIQSQTAHKILKYNTYANQTALDTADVAQYKCLGRHENRFGIVPYDTDLYYGKQKGNDDYLSNFADTLAEDYDISLDMVVASADKAAFTTKDNQADTYDCLDTWVEEADKLENGGTVEGRNKKQYATDATIALAAYNKYASETIKPKEELDSYIKGAIQSLQGTYTGNTNYGARGTYNTFLGGFKSSVSNSDLIDLLNYTIDTGEYYMVFWPVYSTNTDITFASGKISSTMFGSEFVGLYEKYRDAKDKELDALDVYKKDLRRSYGKDFMKKQYSILVLGPSDSFGGFKVDLKQRTCEYILDYVSNGGDLFFFHDTMTPYADAGAVNLTKSLLDIVGMNRFHVDLTNNANTYEVVNDGYVTGVTREGLVKGTLTEDGYIYTKQVNSGTPAGVKEGTLTEDGYIYEHKYNIPWDDNSWEDVGTVSFIYSNYTEQDDAARKWAKAGTKGFIYQDAVTYDQYSYITDWGGIDTGYFSKEEAKAGTSGYIYQEGGKPTYSDKNTSLAYKSEDADLYYLTPYVNNSIAGKSLVNSINANMTQIASSYNKVGNIGMYVSALSMTSLYYDKNGGGGATYTLPYVYAQSDFQSATAWSASATADQSANSQTVKAKQLNEGLITLYPYKIGDSLNISGTHQQVYALDLEAGDVTVWYTLAGSNNSSDAKKRSSLYAADPYDGMENYYIYTTSYGNGAITYCGAGHGSVTGPTTRNNDERKLFINVIVNSAEAVKAKPTLYVYDPDTDFKNEMAKDEEISESIGKTVYLNEVADKTTSPEFDFKINIPDDVTVDAINVYYDLDYDDTDMANNRPAYAEGTDRMIWNTPASDKEKAGIVEDSASTKKIQIKDKFTDSDNLKPTDELFAPYGGNYTYIVVEVYYNGKTKPVYTMIKVKASDPLFNLTQSDSAIQVAANDVAYTKKFVLA